MLDREERFAWLAFMALPGLGGVLGKRLVDRFGSGRDALEAEPSEWRGVEGIGPKLIETRRTYRPDREAILREMDRIEELELDLIALNDPAYPMLLKAIDDPPPLLYIRGGFTAADERAVAVVGARRASGYGRSVTERLSRELAANGLTVVSGLARGIDAWAHRAALEAGGRTIGVLGCGLDVTYPREHRDLMDAMSRQGAVISEFPLGTPPEQANFPRRNRVISGLSRGVVVVEAARRSGSLITARLALDQGREVFAVPGPVGAETSAGAHALIKQGAKLVEDVNDILEELKASWETAEKGANQSASRSVPKGPDFLPDERQVYESLSTVPRHIDELTAELRLPASRMAGVLLQLELKGAARQLAGNWFMRRL